MLRAASKLSLFAYRCVALGVALGLTAAVGQVPHPTSAPPVPTGYIHRSWGTEQGLPQSSVTAILQTHDGYLWLGTLGGLARFDGINFTIFDTTNTPALKSARVRALEEDGQGNLWIGTEHGGLAEYSHGAFHWHSLTDGLPADVVTSLARDGQNGIFAGTTSGLAHWDGKRFAPLTSVPPLPRDTVYALHLDRHGDLWAGTQESGLIEICPDGPGRYRAMRPVAIKIVTALAEDSDGSLWVGARAGLFHLSAHGLLPARTVDGLPLGPVESLDIDKAGTLWVGSATGLFHSTGNDLKLLARARTGGDNVARALFTDREGSTWAGTEAAGMEQWVHTDARSYGADDGFTDNPTATIYQERSGRIWIGSIGAGLFHFDHNSFTRDEPSGEIRKPASLAADRENNLWIGDWDQGLWRRHGSTLTHIELPDLANKVIRSEYVDSRGRLWIGTDHGGLYKYENNVFTNFRTKDGLLSDIVVYITEDHAGRIWLGSPEGLSRFDGAKFTNYQIPDLRLVRTIYEDPHGSFWIGTYGYGLFRLRADKFTRITPKDGLPDAVVSTILADRRGNFWMSGNRGIFRCSGSELNAVADRERDKIYCVSYGASDGLEVSETNGVGEPAAIAAQDHKLWFSMVKGVAVIDPEAPAGSAPPIVIEQVMLDGRPVASGDSFRIPPGAKSLQIDYGALSFLRPQQIQFRYRLDGLDSHWTEGGNRRTVVYQNLAPGRYTFTVVGDNGFGVWNKQGASLHLLVVPPFWRTIWFGVLTVALLITAATLLYQFGLRRLKRAHATQEKFSRLLIDSQERERQRIASELHDGLGQSLLIIKNRAFLALHSVADPEVTTEQLEEISGTASEAVDEVRAITYGLHPYRLDRFGLTKALQGMCIEAGESSGISFQTDFDPIDGLFSKEAESSIFRIVQELVSNILKHAATPKAGVSVKLERGEVQIIVNDEGRGFSRSAEPGGDGGFGLIGMAERVRMLGGVYSLTSTLGSGTRILIRLPL